MTRIRGYFTLSLFLFLSARSGNSAPLSQGQDVVTTFAPGPDVVAGELSSLVHIGSSGTQVGLAVGSDSCNNGNVELDFFANAEYRPSANSAKSVSNERRREQRRSL
jgi:hypothetical protein